MILDKIVNAKRKRLELEKAVVSVEELKRKAEISQTKNFKEAISKKDRINIIGELKKASPSKGIIKKDFDFVNIGRTYEENGIDAISILTEEDFFLGKKEYLEIVSKEVSIPILRKDFIIDCYQIYEAKAIGADAILLIAAILSRKQLIEFQNIAKSIGLDILVEVHDIKELEKVLDIDFEIIGINNRNLNTFEVDIRTTEKLIKYIPKEKIIISESGISTREDMKFLEDIGVNGVLIGESLMKSSSIENKINELRGYLCD